MIPDEWGVYLLNQVFWSVALFPVLWWAQREAISWLVDFEDFQREMSVISSKMTPVQVNLLGSALIQAMDVFVDRGGRIVSRTFGDHKNMCPVACLLASRPDIPNEQQLHSQLSKVMGFPVSERELWSFVFTFDHGEITFFDNYPELSQLAINLRYRYLKVPVPGDMPVIEINSRWKRWWHQVKQRIIP